MKEPKVTTYKAPSSTRRACSEDGELLEVGLHGPAGRRRLMAAGSGAEADQGSTIHMPLSSPGTVGGGQVEIGDSGDDQGQLHRKRRCGPGRRRIAPPDAGETELRLFMPNQPTTARGTRIKKARQKPAFWT